MNTPFPKTNGNAKVATPADLSKAQDAISKAIAGMVLGASADEAFFACMIMNTPRVFNQKIGTACMGLKEMTLNPLYVNSLANVGQRKHLLAHEILHKVLHHIARLGNRNPRAANQAMDKVVNDILVAGSVGEPIPGGIYEAGARAFKWEDLYQEPPPDDGSGDGYGNGDGGYGIGDDIDTSHVSDAELKEAEAEVRVQVAQAAKAAKMRGKMSAELDRLVDEITVVKTMWYDRLKHLFTSVTQGDYSWSRPNRRYIGSGLYMPAVIPEPALGTCVFGIDTSGSISEKILASFLQWMNHIMTDCTPEKVKIIWCDDKAFEGEEFGVDDYPITSKMLRARGGGGTSFAPVFEMVDKLGLNPDILVYLTDGYGDQAELTVPPDYPVIWVTTDQTEGFRFGDVVKMEEAVAPILAKFGRGESFVVDLKG